MGGFYSHTGGLQTSLHTGEVLNVFMIGRSRREHLTFSNGNALNPQVWARL